MSVTTHALLSPLVGLSNTFLDLDWHVERQNAARKANGTVSEAEWGYCPVALLESADRRGRDHFTPFSDRNDRKRGLVSRDGGLVRDEVL